MTRTLKLDRFVALKFLPVHLDPVRNDRAFQRILAQALAKHENFKKRFFPR